MKCIRCNTDNDYKERTANNGRCKNCQHPFVFEPRADINMTDPRFLKSIASLSFNHNLSFTPKQFHYFLNHQLQKKRATTLVELSLDYILGMGVFIAFSSGISSLFSSDLIAVVISFAIALFFAILILMGSTQVPGNSPEIRHNSTVLLIIFGFLQIVFGVTWGIYFDSLISYCVFTGMGLIAIWSGISQKRKLSEFHDAFYLPLSQFQEWLTKWQQINGTIPQLLTPPDNVLPGSSQTTSADIANYSFDRAVICDSAEIAQMLIANNFHIENNCAILSITGYPPDSFSAIKTMLQRNPNLQVYALHDLSPQGLNLTQQLRQSSDWFANTSIPIIDVGLTPAQILNASRRFSFHRSPESAEAAKRLPPQVRETLTPEQYAWLERGNYIELEAFSPRKLIRILQRSLRRGQQLEGAENTLFLVEENDENSLYAAESFG